jgi:large subunit ribosomal protein L23
MLRVVHGNRVETLLATLLEALPPADPFAPSTIVIGSHLVQRWLTREIAFARGLASGLELITFDTWLFGQIGDKDALDLKAEEHWEVWFSFGAWIGETIRRRHGGHWLLMGDDPHTWRIGFSKLLLEIAPFQFSEQLLRMGSGATRKMVAEIERIRVLHEEQKERDHGQSLDRFLAQHYIRMHTVPLGQWMAMDCAGLAKLWNEETVAKLIEVIKERGPRLGPQNGQIVENRYTFKVHQNAHKTQIRQAVEQLFDVHVVRVNVIKVQPKPKRRGMFSGTRPGWKKAIVELKAGEKIDIFEGAQL